MQYKKQEKFRLRKSKKYKNLCSVALGLTVATAIGLASDNQAHASENEVVKTENPATNSPEAQPEITAEALDSQNKENEKNGELNVSTNTTTIDNAVAEANNNGLKVEKKEDVNIGTATNILEAREKEKKAEENYTS